MLNCIEVRFKYLIMKKKKCLNCVKEFQTDSDEKYCSEACEKKANGYDKENKKSKYGILDHIIDFFSSLF